jgi:hypothetical protein
MCFVLNQTLEDLDRDDDIHSQIADIPLEASYMFRF